MTEQLQDPGWHLFDFEPLARSCQWLELAEAQFRAASFLDQRLLQPGAGQPEGMQPLSLPLRTLHDWAAHNPAGRMHFIFHIGHCGSTLLSRALAATPSILPLREPLGLRRLAAMAGTADLEVWIGYLQPVLAAHSRVFHPGQVSMVKATSTCNALVLPIMERVPQTRVLLVYLRLESYLAGMLGKQTPAADLHGHAAARLQEWQAITRERFPEPANSLNEVQLAVLAWLVGTTRLLEASRLQPRHCHLLDFDVFLQAPEEGLSRLCEFFELGDARAETLAAWPEISLGYSKQPSQAYSAFNRNRTLARGRTQRAADLEAGLQFAQSLAHAQPALRACLDYF
jgi:hypothetical protein